MDKKSWLKIPNIFKTDHLKNKDYHSKRWTSVGRINCTGGWNPFAHFDCPCNLVIGLANRVLAETGKVTKEYMDKINKIIKLWTRRAPTILPLSREQAVNTMSGPRYTRYNNSRVHLDKYGFKDKFARVNKVFIKSIEKGNPILKINPDPRVLQPYDYRYMLELMRYIKPIEHWILSCEFNQKGFPRGRAFAKGLSLDARGELIAKKWSAFSDPVAFSIDMSRFDQHVSEEMLLKEFAVYLAIIKDPKFKHLLNLQIVTRGFSQYGISYKSHGTRASGLPNTGLGNCVQSLLMTVVVMEQLQIENWDLLNDGDDSLVFVERKDLDILREGIKTEFAHFGHECKIDNVAYSMENIFFCQTHPVKIGKSYRMIRDPAKVLSTSLAGGKFYNDALARGRLIRSIGLGELMMNRGVPVLQAWARCLLRNSLEHKPFDSKNLRDAYKYSIERETMGKKWMTDFADLDISGESRVSFQEAFGWDYSYQRHLEDYFSTLVIDFTTTTVRDDFDLSTWTQLQDYTVLNPGPVPPGYDPK